MRLPKRTFATAAVIAAATTGVIFAAVPASASAPCWTTTRGDVPVGGVITIHNVPQSADWSDCL
jgi:hypothetical protein